MDQNDINRIIEETIEKKYSIEENDIDKKIRKNRLRKKYSFLISLAVVGIPLLVLFLIFLIDWGKRQLGWFETYDGMYKVELPIEVPAKGGTLYIPND